MNVREVVGLDPNYAEINREERNYAAVFYSALLRPGNIEKFLGLLGVNETPGDDFGIYFEYAYLRDIWRKIPDDEAKRSVLRHFLPISNIEELSNLPPVELNSHFGAGVSASNTFVQQPGKWALSKYDKTIVDNDDFLTICKFKWSFNIKPDIVIHLDKDRAICIEAKYKSGEGQYPGTDRDKAVFNRRDISYVGQMELQKFMMEDLLGIQTDFVFLVHKKSKSETHKVVTWAEVFQCMETSELPPFAQIMIQNVS